MYPYIRYGEKFGWLLLRPHYIHLSLRAEAGLEKIVELSNLLLGLKFFR